MDNNAKHLNCELRSLPLAVISDGLSVEEAINRIIAAVRGAVDMSTVSSVRDISGKAELLLSNLYPDDLDKCAELKAPSHRIINPMQIDLAVTLMGQYLLRGVKWHDSDDRRRKGAVMILEAWPNPLPIPETPFLDSEKFLA